MISKCAARPTSKANSAEPVTATRKACATALALYWARASVVAREISPGSRAGLASPALRANSAMSRARPVVATARSAQAMDCANMTVLPTLAEVRASAPTVLEETSAKPVPRRHVIRIPLPIPSTAQGAVHVTISTIRVPAPWRPGFTNH